MADTVTSQTIYDGPGYAVIQLTSVSDGTGEAAVTKVDPALLAGAPSEVIIERIAWAVAGMAVNILWNATTDVLAFVLPQDTANAIDFRAPPLAGREQGRGLMNSGGAGKDGKIQFTTIGHTAGDAYSITLWLKKHNP